MGLAAASGRSPPFVHGRGRPPANKRMLGDSQCRIAEDTMTDQELPELFLNLSTVAESHALPSFRPFSVDAMLPHRRLKKIRRRLKVESD